MNIENLVVGKVYKVTDTSVSSKDKDSHRRVQILKFVKIVGQIVVFVDKIGLERSFMKRQFGISFFVEEI